MHLSKVYARCTAVLALAAAAPAAAHAQEGTVTGTVVEAASGRPVAAAAIILRSAADTSRTLRAATGPDGRFRVTGAAPGTYGLQATALGHVMQRRPGVVVPAAGGVVDVGTIRLAVSAIALRGVEAVTQRSQVQVAADRTIYSTSEMPVAAGGMAADVLRSVPELEVDVNGAVQLRGTPAQIYLNGRPAPMQGESLELFLQQFPADRIERVEVIPNPSARFEAEGAGGIVNIVLKKDTDLGLSGNLFANGGSRGDIGVGGRITYQQGRVTLFGGGFVRRSDRYTTSYDLRRNLLADPVSELEQDGFTDRQGLSGNLDLTTELKLSERSTLWSTLGFWRNGFDADGVTIYTRSDTLGTLFERYDRASLSERSSLSTDLSLGFRHSFAPQRREQPAREGAGPGQGGRGEGGRMPGGMPGGGHGPGGGPGGGGGGPGGGGLSEHELTVQIEHENQEEDAFSRVRRQLLGEDEEPLGLPVQLTLDDTDGGERERQAQIDYVRPWGASGKIELGYRGEIQDTDDARLLEVFPDESASLPGTSTATGYDFRETFHSGYVTLSRTMGRLNVQAGLRAERADTRLALAEAPGVFQNGYTSLFPSANLRYDLRGGREVRLQYSRRVRRPGPWVLNPVNRTNDPLNRVVGNPELEPQYSHSLSVETSWSGALGSVRFSPYFRRTENDWVQIRRVDEAGVQTQTWENLATVEQLGTSLTLALRPTGGVSGSLSLSGTREVRSAGSVAPEISGDALWWNARGNVSARVTPRLALQGMFFYQPEREVAQGTVSSSLMTHVGVRQQFSARATLNLMVTDPFDLYRQSFESRDPTFVQIGRSRWSARQAVVSFTYAFGRPPRRRAAERGDDGPPEEQDEGPPGP
ncbi:MAG TPA: TonB-dependent receptor [Longimicrobium sp.]|jgi:outer membrane receptor protein involved in Fe transport